MSLFLLARAFPQHIPEAGAAVPCRSTAAPLLAALLLIPVAPLLSAVVALKRALAVMSL